MHKLHGNISNLDFKTNNLHNWLIRHSNHSKGHEDIQIKPLKLPLLNSYHTPNQLISNPLTMEKVK